jgi:hypothetical protein
LPAESAADKHGGYQVSKNLVIIPTRGRDSVIGPRIIESLSLSVTSDFCISIDEDDTGDYSWAKSNGIVVVSGPARGMNVALNRAVEKFAADYEYITFMGDDHAVRTREWDSILIDSIKNKGYGIAYGDDLITHGSLPTFAMVSTNIIQTLGFLAPPQLKHMYLDDYWLRLGRDLEACFYREDVIVEHLHHSVGKSAFDSTYQATNRHIVNLRDRISYYLYLKGPHRKDIKSIKTRLWIESN